MVTALSITTRIASRLQIDQVPNGNITGAAACFTASILGGYFASEFGSTSRRDNAGHKNKDKGCKKAHGVSSLPWELDNLRRATRLAFHHGSDALANSFVGGPHWVACQMRVACRCGRLGMT